MSSKQLKISTKQSPTKTSFSVIPNDNDSAPEPRARVCVFCGSSRGKSPAHPSAARALAEALAQHDMDLVYGGGTVGIMGEVARTLVSLKGKESVEGVIPGGVMSAERPEASGKGNGGLMDKAKKRSDELKKGWWARRRYLGSGKGSASAASAGKGKEKEEMKVVESQINDKFGKVTITSDLAARKAHMLKSVATAGLGSGFVALSGGFGTMDEVMEMVTMHHHGVHRRRVAFFNVDGFWDHIGLWIDKAVEAGFVRPESKEIVAIRDTAEGVVKWLKEGV